MYRFVFINSFSLIKRLFLDPFIYNIIKFIPLLVIPNPDISKSAVKLIFILISILVLSLNFSSIIYLFPFFLLILFKNNLNKIDLYSFVEKSKWFLLIAILYGFLQLYFQYLPFERNWINSDLSIVNSENMFISERGIRPFSFFSSNSEFTFFCSIYLLVFLRDKKRIWSLIAFIGVVSAGSRGIILAFVFSYLLVYFFKIRTKLRIVVISLFTSLLIYASLVSYSAILYNFSNTHSSNRLLLFGTFYARYENILTRSSEFGFFNLIIPSTLNFNEASSVTFDNMHISLLANFGLIGYLFFWNFFKIKKTDFDSLFFLSMLIISGFFNDMIYSFYMFYLILFAIYTKKKYD